MNTRSRFTIAALSCVLLVATFFHAAPMFAQEAASTASDPSSVIAPETAAAIATPIIVGLAVKYPWLLTALAAVGAFRFFFKPVVSVAEAYVKSTPSKADDEMYEKATHSALFKWFAWLLDFAFSIKVGPQFTAKPEANK